jgi:diguanylate cyclase (GGDEF)-like protein
MKIVVGEDNPVFQTLLKGLLKAWGYEVLIARNGQEAWALLSEEGGPRLAILDWMMPAMEGVEVCRRVRAEVRDRYIYILLLTARIECDDVVAGIEAGADDYVTKPFKVPELRARLRAGLRVLALQDELIMAREALREQATRDGLTHLWNRTAILQVLDQELSRASRNKSPLALMMADLDHFKQINDTYGHHAGDAVLREAASRMSGSVRRHDFIGRYGGEEFLIVLPDSHLDGAIAQAERLREAMAAEAFHVDELFLSVTASFGVAWLDHPTPDQADDLLRQADAGLYQAKREGRNRVAAAERSPQPVD